MKNFTLRNIYEWPLTLRLLALGLLSVLVFYICYKLDINSLSTKLLDARQKEQDLKQQIQSVISKQNTVKNEIAQYSQTQNILAEWQKKLVLYAELPELIKEILKVGANNHIQFNLFHPDAPVNEGNYIKVPITIIAVGSYHQIATFISQIANIPWIVSIGNFTIATEIKPKTAGSKPENEMGAGNLLTANLTFEVFYLAEKTTSKQI